MRGGGGYEGLVVVEVRDGEGEGGMGKGDVIVMILDRWLDWIGWLD